MRSPGQTLFRGKLEMNAAGYLKTAREAWQQALDILDDLRHPDAEPVRTKLRQLDAGEAPRTGN